MPPTITSSNAITLTAIRALVYAPPGCLTGDTLIPINRAGKGSKIRLDRLVKRANHQPITGIKGGFGKWDWDIPTKVQAAFGETVQLHDLAAGVFSGDKLVYQVTTDRGRTIRATLAHPFLTPDQGFVPLEALGVGSAVQTNVGKGGGEARRHIKAHYSSVAGMRHHPYARPGSKDKGYYRVSTHRLVAEAAANGLEYGDFVERCAEGRTEGIQFWSPATWAVYHINGDHEDNRPENLTFLTHDAHRQQHLHDGQWLQVQERVADERIVDIKREGVQPTFDLTMAGEPHNFIANGFVVHNSGKTFSSLTLSEQCPAWLTHERPKTLVKREPVELTDMLWIAFDKGATDGFKQQGLSVPLIDLSAEGPETIAASAATAVKLAKQRADEGLTKVVVIDTVTALDEMLVGYNSVVRGLEKLDLYGALKQDHIRIALPFGQLKCHVLFLCHAKAKSEMGGTSATAQLVANNQRRQAAASGSGDIMPAITGGALNLYRRNVSFEFSQVKETTGGVVRNMFLTEHHEQETKSRTVLPAKVPADWRVVKKMIEGAA